MTQVETRYSVAKFMEILHRHIIGEYLTPFSDETPLFSDENDIADNDPVLRGDFSELMLSHKHIKSACCSALHFLTQTKPEAAQ